MDAVLGRAISMGSTTSSMAPELFSRRQTSSTTATTPNGSGPLTLHDGSTTLLRDDSIGSYGPSTSYSKRTYDVDDYHHGSADSLDRPHPGVYDLAESVTDPVDVLGEDDEEEYFTDSDDSDPDRFVNFSLLSHLAVRLRDKVPRGTHVKSSIPYPRAFTGKDIVVRISCPLTSVATIDPIL